MSGPDTVNNVLIVGGGDAGLLTALCLRERLSETSIRVVDDFDEEIPQVGKSTYYTIGEILHERLGIDESRFVNNVKPVWKTAVMFDDWFGYDRFFAPFDSGSIPMTNGVESHFREGYYRYITDNLHTKCNELALQEKTPFMPDGSDQFSKYPTVAYHFSIERLNKFLREICRERGVEFVNDRVVNTVSDGEYIEYVETGSGVMSADLYVDAAGFSRPLASELDNDFISYEFPLDCAVKTNWMIGLDEIVPATVVDSAPNGWMWQIDTYDGRDKGYVYSSAHTSDSDAKATFLDECPDSVTEDDLVTYRFDSGAHEKAWVGNCVLIGNAYGFVEPLQSTALTSAAVIGDTLGKTLLEHNNLMAPGMRQVFNDSVNDTWDSIYEFIALHYRHLPGDTKFENDLMESVRHVKPIAEEIFNKHGFTQSHGYNRLYNEERGIVSLQLSYFILQGMNVKSDFYEQLDDKDAFPTNEEKRMIDAYTMNLKNEVNNHLDYSEYYQLLPNGYNPPPNPDYS